MLISRDLSLRPATAGDEAFLFDLFQSTREAEARALASSEEGVRTFMALQFAARNRAYRSAFPEAEQTLVIGTGQAVGALWVDRKPSSLRLLDIALRPEFRGAGIGTQLIRRLQGEARERNCSLYLHVMRSSPAAALYERLGFVAVEPQAPGPYFELEWRASRESAG